MIMYVKKLKNGRKFLALALGALMLLSACTTSRDIAPSPTAGSAPPADAPSVSSPEPPAASGDKTVVISLASAWDNLNVFDYGNDYAMYVKSQIFDKLVVLDRSGAAKPRLLSSWEISADGLTVTGRVDENAVWQDGTPVTADDIVFTYSLFTNPSVTTTARTSLISGTDSGGLLIEGETLGVYAIDGKTVEFNVKQRTQEILFFSDADKFFIVPKHLLESSDPATIIDDPFFGSPVGSGPFAFESQIIGTQAVLRANGDYFKGAPRFDRLMIRVISNNNVLSGLLSGEVDVTGGTGISALPYSDFLLAEADDRLTTKSLPHLGAQLIIVNTASPALSDARVRRAIEYAINKQSIVDNLYGGEATALYSPIIPGSAYFNGGLVKNEYDPDRARELLDEAGFDYNAVVRVYVPAGVTEREQAAVLFQQDLAAVGVRTDINVLEFAAVASALSEDGFDLCFMGYTPTVAPNAYKGWFGPGNTSALEDPAIFDAYGRAEAAGTDDEAKRYYNEAQQLIEEQLPLIFLYSANNLLAHSHRIGNIDFDNYFITDNIYEWTVD